MTNPIDGHTYGTDPITGYKTIDGLIVGIDRAPACRGGRKAVRHILAGFGAEEFTTAGVEAAIKAHDKPYMAKATAHWQVWHEFYQAAAKPVNTFGEWFHNAIGDALTGVDRDNPELLTRLSRKLNSRSRWQVVHSESAFQQLADQWAIDHPEDEAQQGKLVAAPEEVEEVREDYMATEPEPVAEPQRYFLGDGQGTIPVLEGASSTVTPLDVEGVLDVEPPDEEGINVVGITLPAPAEPYFTVFVRERNTYKRVRLRSENRDAAAVEVAKSNPGADLIEVFAHEGLIYTQQWAEVKVLQVADNG